MSMTPFVHTKKEELREAMEREIGIIRTLLSSLHEEHNAILSKNELIIESVIDERVTIVGSFEHWSEKVVTLIHELAVNAKQIEPEEVQLRHSEAITLLQSCLDPDDFELHFLKDQVEALIREVYHQNDLNAQLILDKVDISESAYYKRQQINLKPKAKITVSVIER